MQESTMPDEVMTDEVEQVISLLSGAPEKATQDAPEGEPASNQTESAGPEGETPAAAPEKALDYEMMVPITGGEPVTLGQLKDAWQARQANELKLIERENAVLRQSEKANLLLSYVGNLPPEAREAAQRDMVSDYQAQMRALQEFIPEAKTPEGARALKADLIELAAEYGVRPQEVEQIKNAVTIKMMHDFSRLRKQIKEARDNVKPLRQTSPRATQTASTPDSDIQALAARAKRTRSVQDETRAVEALLRKA